MLFFTKAHPPYLIEESNVPIKKYKLTRQYFSFIMGEKIPASASRPMRQKPYRNGGCRIGWAPPGARRSKPI